MKKVPDKAILKLLATASCLSLLMGLQAIATAAVQQPLAILADEAVSPAGCTDTCCGDEPCNAGTCAGDCSKNSCCKAICCPKSVKTEVKKYCWKVSTKQICIPGFTFKINGFKLNWNRPRCNMPGCDQLGCSDCSRETSCSESGNCPPKPGRVRCIQVLEKQEYTCDKCGYEWEIQCVRSANGCSRGRCGCPSCGTQVSDWDALADVSVNDKVATR